MAQARPLAHALFTALLLVMGCSEYDITHPDATPASLESHDLDAVSQVDRIVQVPPEAVDVLWVVDNSCSMADEQAYLTYYFPRFMEWFVGSGIDYHIGVVSTDMEDPRHRGRLREREGHPFIDTDNPEPVDLFAEMATVGTRGSGEEKGIAAAYAALETNARLNQGFRRPDANLHVVVISDEEDHTGEGDEVTQQDLIDHLLELQDDQGLDVTFSSIVNPEDCDCPPQSYEEPGTRYREITAEVGGMVWDIHKKAWEILLGRLGMQAAGLSQEFFLSRVPDLPTLTVVIDLGDEQVEYFEGIDWVYDFRRNSIIFHEVVPPSQSQVVLTYEVLSTQ